MRFRLRKRYQVLAAVLAVAALWTMGIWPFGGAAPLPCAIAPAPTPTTLSPLAQARRCYGSMLAAAKAAAASEACEQDDADKNSEACKQAKRNAKQDDFDRISASIDMAPDLGLTPSLFPIPTQLALCRNQATTLDWPRAADGPPVLIGRIDVGRTSGSVAMNFTTAGRNASRTIPAGGATRIGVVGENGGRLTLACSGKPCLIRLGYKPGDSEGQSEQALQKCN